MGYSSGAKITANIVEDIAVGLIASAGGYWTNADATWTTADKTQNNSKRALKYLNGAEEIYLALEVINQTSGALFCTSHYGKGIIVTFSATWDSINHIYPVSNQQTFMPFEAHTASISADLATLLVTYYLWIDASGFVITGKPEPSASTSQQSFLIVVERNTNKEYTDGYSNFYALVVGNLWSAYYHNSYTKYRNRCILRPFSYTYPPDGAAFTTYIPNGNGISYITTSAYYAFKSSGNGKVYYVKPIVNNLPSTLSPIFQAELWFPWSETVGLIDGDVIAIEGQTTKYLCKALDSPDSATRLTYGIKYVA